MYLTCVDNKPPMCLEYCTTANTCKEASAQRALFKAFRIDFPTQYPILVDNQSAIALACGPAANHQRIKHIDTKYHYVNYYWLEWFDCNIKTRRCKWQIF
jgi:hypothetical protein